MKGWVGKMSVAEIWPAHVMWPSGQYTRATWAVERDALRSRSSNLRQGASTQQRIISNNSHAHDEHGDNPGHHVTPKWNGIAKNSHSIFLVQELNTNHHLTANLCQPAFPVKTIDVPIRHWPIIGASLVKTWKIFKILTKIFCKYNPPPRGGGAIVSFFRPAMLTRNNKNQQYWLLHAKFHPQLYNGSPMKDKKI